MPPRDRRKERIEHQINLDIAANKLTAAIIILSIHITALGAQLFGWFVEYASDGGDEVPLGVVAFVCVLVLILLFFLKDL